MTLYLKVYQKYDNSKLKNLNLLNKSWIFNFDVIFLIPLEVQGHTVPHLKALKYDKEGSRQLCCGCTFSTYQDVLKNDNLLHKQGFVDFIMYTTVINHSVSVFKLLDCLKMMAITLHQFLYLIGS